MPNLIVELNQEITRVEGLLGVGELRYAEQSFVLNALRSAKTHLAMNSYEGMREALDDLREIGQSKKKSEP